MTTHTTVDLNPATAVAANARYFGERAALASESGTHTYRDLDDQAARLACVLSKRGIREGDRVAYVGLNSPAFVLTMLAAFRIGAIYVPVNFRLAGPELAQVLSRSGAIAVIAEEGYRAAVDAVRDQTFLSTFLLVDNDTSCPAPDVHAGWVGWAVELATADRWDTIDPRTSDQVAILMFTSGTTGTPKGVELTFGNVWWNAVNVDSRLDTRRGDVTYAAAPLFHIGALNSFALRTLARGGTVVTRRTFDPETCLRDLVDHGVNSTFLVPAMVAALARVPGIFDADLTALRSIVVAGAPVPPSLIQTYADHGLLLQQAWGLTETAPFATHLPAEHTLDKLGSAGIAMPFTQVRVVDPDTGEEQATGVAGELVVRGPNVTPGYWEDGDATAAAIDAEGWFHSGDIGYMDEDGYVFVVDRLKDMVISGGENVYPAEVERALADMSGVMDVAVVGVPDPEWGERVVAVITTGDEDGDAAQDITLERVREHAAKSIARYKLPREIQLVPAVPRNASGKLDKVAIRRLIEDEL